jgi:hypothetical protein
MLLNCYDTTNIIGSTISGNTAGRDGGGVMARNLIAYYPTSGLNVTNSTVSGNSAVNNGGGIGVYGAATPGPYGNSPVKIANTTIVFNDAGAAGLGGGIQWSKNTGTLQLDSTIVALNTVNKAVAPTSDLSADAALTTAGGKNLIGVQDPATNVTLGGVNQSGTVGVKLDPQISSLALNGAPSGSPLTHALKAGSPAIDQGSNVLALTTDQRGVGFAREFPGGLPDVGAFELQPVAAPAKVSNVQINDGSAQRSRVTSLTVSFSQTVTLPTNPADAFQLRRHDGALVTLSASVAGSVVTLTFIGGAVESNSLADGRYDLTIFANQVNGGIFDGDNDGVAEGSPTDDFVFASASTGPPNNIFRLFGDSDGNGTVTSTDFAMFRTVFGVAGPIFDFDNNGVVNSNDFAEFRKRFGLSI